jgi:nicotinamide-nucleotide amidase
VTGDEVLGGRVGEGNAGFLARDLAGYGIRVERTLIVGDDVAAVRDGVGALLSLGVDLVCTTGGLGPTYDDLTMAAVAEAVGRAMAVDTAALAMVDERSRGVPRRFGVDEESLEAMRRKQATLPEGATVLPPAGTAPGCVLDHDSTLLVVLPGPPWELQSMWSAAVAGEGPLRDLLGRAPGATTRTFRLWQVIEAELVEALSPLSPDDLDEIGTYTREGELEVVVPTRLAERVGTLLTASFADAVFATDGDQVDAIVAAALRRRGERLSVAESCTGGGLGARITAMPGSSDWFVGGVIAYANAVKISLLGVDPAVIEAHGAVSRQCVMAMADGVRRATGAEWGIAVTGVAGPGGGTADKPVGLVWIGVAGDRGTEGFELRARGDRASIRRRAQTSALHHLRVALMAPA